MTPYDPTHKILIIANIRMVEGMVKSENMEGLYHLVSIEHVDNSEPKYRCTCAFSKEGGTSAAACCPHAEQLERYLSQ